MTSSGIVPTEARHAPAVVVINPSGNRSRMPLDPLPFTIGRHGDNHLVLRDNRASRSHARIVADNGEHFIEDLNSRHGVFVNGQRITRHAGCSTSNMKRDIGGPILRPTARSNPIGFCCNCGCIRRRTACGTLLRAN